jgi:hypothetical protein
MDDDVCVAVECHLLLDDNSVEPELAIVFQIQKAIDFISIEVKQNRRAGQMQCDGHTSRAM